MQTWAKRGLQTALFTGGLMALGMGVASAAEHQAPVNPLGVPNVTDVVAGAVDVPVNISSNDIATPLGHVGTPDVRNDISTKNLTGSFTHPLADKSARDDILRRNEVRPAIVAPVNVAGNAIGLGGTAYAENNNSLDAAYAHRSVTNGDKDTLAGNVVALDYALPVDISGNAIALLGGNAETHNTSSVDASAGRTDIITSGNKGTLVGNIVAGQLATPVQVTGNAIAWVGNAESHNKADATGTAGGALKTSGMNSTGGGNIVGAPVGLPVEANGNAISWIGNGDATSATTDTVTTGGQRDGNYAATNGDPATGAGNIVDAPVATPVMLAGNAVSWIGNDVANGTTDNTLKSGGNLHTTGAKSTGSGNIVDPNLALPVEVFGDGVTWIGTAFANNDNTVHAIAGGTSITNGDKSTLGANSVTAPLGGTADVFGSAASLIGNSGGTATNNAQALTGGYSGSTGNGAVGGGNLVSAPVALPAEVFGLGAAGAGNADAVANEVKDVESGWDLNGNDDFGAISSNIAQVPVTAPVQAFGDAVGVVANVTGASDSQTTTTVGHNDTTRGTKGSGSGNVAQVPVSLPTQLFGDAATLVGNGDAKANGMTDSIAGGDNRATGDRGSVSGNIAAVPVAGAIQGLGAAVAGAGLDDAHASNLTSSKAGGLNQTTGDFGSLTGNAALVPLSPAAEVAGDAVSAAGVGNGVADNKVFTKAGDALNTSGKGAGIGGNAAVVPVAGTAGVIGDAATLGGLADAVAHNSIDPQAGGNITTSGMLGSVSGNVAQVPGAANALVLGDSVGALGNSASATESFVRNLAGGKTTTSGMFGAISGDVAQVPAAADAQVLADAVGAGGLAGAKSSTQEINRAGGDTLTSGRFGSVAGDVASLPLVGNAEVDHDAVSGAGQAFHAGANKSVDHVGGDLFSDGTAGSVAGDLVQVPVIAVPQVFGDAVSVAGISANRGVNVTDVQAAGRQATSGAINTLSGVDGRLPLGAVAQVFDIPLAIVAQATTQEANITDVKDSPLVDLPVSRGLLGAVELPGVGARSLPTAGLPLAGGLGGLTNLVSLDKLTGVAGHLPVGAAQQRSLPAVPGLDGVTGLAKGLKVPGLPAAGAEQRDLPAMGALPTDNLVPAANLAQLPKLDGIKLGGGLGGQRDLPGVGGLGDLGAVTAPLNGLHI